MNIRKSYIGIFCLALILMQYGCGTFKKNAASNTVIINGKIDNFQGDHFTFSYDVFSLLKGTQDTLVDIDEAGNFHLKIETEDPIKGRFDFGRVMQKTSGINRYIYTYLEPGDSVLFQADVDVLSDPDIIHKSLKISGKGMQNNIYANQEDKVFNTYAQRRQNNYSFIANKQPNDYKRIVDSIRDEKIDYLMGYSKEFELSEKLINIYKSDYTNLAIIRKVNYPSSHKNYNDGVEAALPADYYDFIDQVKIDSDLDDKGLPYLRYTHFLLSNKYKLKRQNGYEADYLTFLDSELEDRAKYVYMAYSLGSDFDPEVYMQFDADAPYPDITKIVKERYGHLESMLPGKPAPSVVLTTVEGNELRSTDFYKGKFTFIDFWATWCKPCIREIPSIVQLEKEYHNENIQFVSISFDEDKQAWKDYVKNEGLQGNQFWVDKDNKAIYDDGFNITMIPRFVLIDPEGKIVDPNAPRPSSGKEIRSLLDRALNEKN